MKVITDNEALVQLNDLLFLQSSDLAIPSSIILKVFRSGITVIDDTNRYDFVRFTEAEDIEYFRQLDWMIDYGKVKNMSEEELENLLSIMLDKMDFLDKAEQSIPVNQSQKRHELLQAFSLLVFKFCSLRDILWYKQGHISLNLPEIEPSGTRKLKKDVKH